MVVATKFTILPQNKYMKYFLIGILAVSFAACGGFSSKHLKGDTSVGSIIFQNEWNQNVPAGATTVRLIHVDTVVDGEAVKYKLDTSYYVQILYKQKNGSDTLIWSKISKAKPSHILWVFAESFYTIHTSPRSAVRDTVGHGTVTTAAASSDSSHKP